MAVEYGTGRIVTNGLVLSLDAADRNSYPGSGTTWRDMSGNNNNGVISGTAIFNSGNGGSLVFDTSNYVIVNNNANILTKTAYTKCCWLHISNFGWNNNLISGDNNSQHAFWLFASPYLQSGHNGSYSLVVSTTSLSLNTWYFGAVTFSTSSGWVLYVNGVSESTNASTTTYTGNDNVQVAAYNAGNFLNGRIACASVYNRALSAAEILQNYNATKSRFGL
jgi:hypothetical protein